MTLQTDNSHPKLDHDYLKDIRVVIEIGESGMSILTSFHPDTEIN